jgi:ubiquinone/menaquinone biosynthesis C-methylase UbiE
MIESSSGMGQSPYINLDVQAQTGEFSATKHLDAIANAFSYKPEALAIFQRGVKPGDSIADFGIGTGIDLPLLVRMVFPRGRVVGVDLSQNMLDQARTRAQSITLSGEPDQSPVQIYLIQADTHSLPFSDGEFDAIRFDRILQHVQDPQQILYEANRVLKPGGLMVASEPDWQELHIIHPDQSQQELSATLEWFKRKVNIRRGMIARSLAPLLDGMGMQEISVTTVQDDITSLRYFEDTFYIEKFLKQMTDLGLPEHKAETWLSRLRDSYSDGAIVCSYTTAIVSARKKL